ncbi:hypothetical protein [Halorarum halophilum]|uniref:hypothetical protein n=1 Tax=Halorarum halophilum TaxID=2743090 RepID=UPI003743EA6A
MRPVLRLYLVQGIEAHQQNSVLTLDDGATPRRSITATTRGPTSPNRSTPRSSRTCPALARFPLATDRSAFVEVLEMTPYPRSTHRRTLS